MSVGASPFKYSLSEVQLLPFAQKDRIELLKYQFCTVALPGSSREIPALWSSFS